MVMTTEKKPVFLSSLCTSLFVDALWARVYLHFTRLVKSTHIGQNEMLPQTVASNKFNIFLLRCKERKRQQQQRQQNQAKKMSFHFVGTGHIAIMYFILRFDNVICYFFLFLSLSLFFVCIALRFVQRKNKNKGRKKKSSSNTNGLRNQLLVYHKLYCLFEPFIYAYDRLFALRCPIPNTTKSRIWNKMRTFLFSVLSLLAIFFPCKGLPMEQMAKHQNSSIIMPNGIF